MQRHAAQGAAHADSEASARGDAPAPARTTTPTALTAPPPLHRSRQPQEELLAFFDGVMASAGGAAGPGSCIVTCKVSADRSYAFLEMRSVEEASNAMALDGVAFRDAHLKVRCCEPVVLTSGFDCVCRACLVPCAPVCAA